MCRNENPARLKINYLRKFLLLKKNFLLKLSFRDGNGFFFFFKGGLLYIYLEHLHTIRTQVVRPSMEVPRESERWQIYPFQNSGISTWHLPVSQWNWTLISYWKPVHKYIPSNWHICLCLGCTQYPLFPKWTFKLILRVSSLYTQKLHLLEEINVTHWTFLAFVNKIASCNFQYQSYLRPVYLSNFKPLNLRHDYIFF